MTHNTTEIRRNGGRILHRQGKCQEKYKEVEPRKGNHWLKGEDDTAILVDKGRGKGRRNEGLEKGNDEA